MKNRTFLPCQLTVLLLAIAYAQDKPYSTVYLEVRKPIVKPLGSKRCSIPLMKNHVFGKSPFSTYFNPPSGCGSSWSLITVSWSAYAFTTLDYVSGGNVFIDGVNIIKTFTILQQEWPFFGGSEGFWSFEVDITKYGAYLKKRRNLSVHFKEDPHSTDSYLRANLTLNYYAGITSAQFADVIVPISPKLTPNSPFNLTRRSNKGQVALSGLPRNIYRAQVEIFQIQGGSDNSHWENYPDELVKAVPAGDKAVFKDGGAFRETRVYVDGQLAGTVWPFAVVKYAGLNTWNPLRAIGAHVAPSYNVDITSFVGKLVDGKSHNISLALNTLSSSGFWEVSGALHLWLDKKSKQTHGKLIDRQIAESVTPKVTYKFKSIYANTTTRAVRKSKVSGFVSTSFGNFTVLVTTNFSFSNDIMTTFPPGYILTVETKRSQYTKGSTVVDMKFKNGSKLFYRSETISYPLIHRTFGSSPFYSNVAHAYLRNTSSQYGKGNLLVETIDNTQWGSRGTFYHSEDIGRFWQTYSYRSNFGDCYYRKVNASQGKVVANIERAKC